jgi:Domain of unknown function (DUF4394)
MPLRRTLLLILPAALAGCALPGANDPAAPPLPPTKVTSVWAVTDAHELIRFAPDSPHSVLARVPLAGLAAGERLVGIDFRVARGVLYALADSGQLYTVDTASGRLSALGQPVPALRPTEGLGLGFDFNPAADRIRVVDAAGRNWRMHPDTGAVVDGDTTKPGLQPDGTLRWREGDANGGRLPRLAGAAYTYHKKDDKLTTNYAIELSGLLVMQGSAEGTQPVVSPNSGLLSTVGELGTGAIDDASFDIADVDNTALAALRVRGRTQLHRVDLATGRARLIGPVADGGRLRGLAIEP